MVKWSHRKDLESSAYECLSTRTPDLDSLWHVREDGEWFDIFPCCCNDTSFSQLKLWKSDAVIKKKSWKQNFPICWQLLKWYESASLLNRSYLIYMMILREAEKMLNVDWNFVECILHLTTTGLFRCLFRSRFSLSYPTQIQRSTLFMQNEGSYAPKEFVTPTRARGEKKDRKIHNSLHLTDTEKFEFTYFKRVFLRNSKREFSLVLFHLKFPSQLKHKYKVYFNMNFKFLISLGSREREAEKLDDPFHTAATSQLENSCKPCRNIPYNFSTRRKLSFRRVEIISSVHKKIYYTPYMAREVEQPEKKENLQFKFPISQRNIKKEKRIPPRLLPLSCK